jgi:hypothetical protein
MTAAERLMLRGQIQQEKRWASTGTFTLDGFLDDDDAPIQWTGVIQENVNTMEQVGGGLAETRSITVTANVTQFEAHNMTPAIRQRLTWRGSNWVITEMPFAGSDADTYTMTAEQVIKGKK